MIALFLSNSEERDLIVNLYQYDNSIGIHDLYKINHACKRIMEESIELMLELIIKDMEADSLPKERCCKTVSSKEIWIYYYKSTLWRKT